jgi:Aspartyl/Asparaginyl beta-hydroxylase
MTAAFIDKIAHDKHIRIRPLDMTPIKPLQEEVERLNEVIVWTEYTHKGKQAGVQYRDGEDPWTSAVGRKQRPEYQYNLLNPAFKGTLIEGLIEKYQLFRTRLMWVNPMSCYSMHRDSTRRIHIPIVTNPGCYFVFLENPPHYLPPGYAYLTDTREYHTFMNCSEEPRLHLVGCVLD